MVPTIGRTGKCFRTGVPTANEGNTEIPVNLLGPNILGSLGKKKGNLDSLVELINPD